MKRNIPGSFRKLDTKYKVLFALEFIFVILTLIGAGYVLLSHGTKSPGYAVIPMLAAFICSSQINLQLALDRKNNDSDDGK